MTAVRKSKVKSAPCPLDGIPYVIFKKCPILLCMTFSTAAGHSLQYHHNQDCSSESDCKTSSCTGSKVANQLPSHSFDILREEAISTILRNRWLSFMLSNGYLDRSVQKAFCLKHLAVLNITSNWQRFSKMLDRSTNHSLCVG